MDAQDLGQVSLYLICVVVIFSIGFSRGCTTKEKELQNEAVKHGKAEWFINTENKAEWRWKLPDPVDNRQN